MATPVLCVLAEWFGLTQESDNHRDSGNLHVAKWRSQGIRARGRKGQAEAINVSEALGVVTAQRRAPRPNWAYPYSPDAIDAIVMNSLGDRFFGYEGE